MKKHENAMDTYLQRVFLCGGIPTTVGEFIREQTKNGVPRRQIDAYLIGQEHSERLKEKQEKKNKFV